MKVILCESIENLGKIGDIIKVSEGYARNYLLPRKLVVAADDQNVKAIEHHQKVLAQKREKEKKSLVEVAKKLEAFSCTIARKVGENEKMYGSVTAENIAHALEQGGFALEKRHIHLEEPIKQLGVFTVPIKLGADVLASVKVWVVQEQ